MELDKLTLLSGNDIFIESFRANVHQPTLREIAIIGEDNFYHYLSIFNITYESFVQMIIKSNEDKEGITEELVKNTLGELSDFQVLMQIVNGDQEIRIGLETILMLIFPSINKFEYEERFLMCNGEDSSLIIDENGYKDLVSVIKTIFCLDVKKEEEFNPVGDKAKSIAEKIKKGREKVREAHGLEQKKTYILANYMSALAIGSHALNINAINDLTVYQLFNQMQRFGLYTQYESAVKAMLAGAKDVEMVDWLEDL